MIRQISLATTNPDASGVILDGLSHPPPPPGGLPTPLCVVIVLNSTTKILVIPDDPKPARHAVVPHRQPARRHRPQRQRVDL